ncbi:MAG: GcrA family cell cycle regulator [Methylocella sp.]
MKTLWELKRHDCRWPVDRVDDAWHFCGEPAAVSQGLPHRYCAAHAALAFARMGGRGGRNAGAAGRLSFGSSCSGD